MNISNLELGETAVTEAGLAHLKQMAELRQLSFSVSPKNKAELQTSLPNCIISP